jgi:uncharacterized protein YggT (Ycf19 family)
MAFLLLVLQTLLLIAGLALFGQLLVGAFGWGRREQNPVYQLFAIVAKPATGLIRAITPRVVLDRHIPIATFMVCLVAYFAVGFYHRDVCLSDLGQKGCEKWVQARAAAR